MAGRGHPTLGGLSAIRNYRTRAARAISYQLLISRIIGNLGSRTAGFRRISKDCAPIHAQSMFGGSPLLPYFTPLTRRTHHRRIFLTTKRLCKCRQVRQRSDHAELRNRVRISLHHFSLRLRTNFIPTKLSPRNEKLLVRRNYIESRSRMLCFRLLESQKSNLRPRQIANALTQNQLPVVMDVRFDKIAVKLARNTRGLLSKAFFVFGSPPVFQTSLRIELRTLIVEAVADLVPDHHADGAIVDRVHGSHIERRWLQNRCRKDDFVQQRRVICIRRWRCHAPPPTVRQSANQIPIIINHIPAHCSGLIVPE